MPACCALNCTNRPEKSSGKTFHAFPRSKPRIFQKWLANLKRDKWKPSPGSRLCSDHFAESCFDRSGARTRLRGDAVHTLFAFPDDSQKKAPERKAPKQRGKILDLAPEDEPPMSPVAPLPGASRKKGLQRRAPKQRGQILELTPEDEPPMSPAAPSPEASDKVLDHDYAVLDNPKVLKKRLEKCTDAIENIKKKLKLSEQRERRLKNKVTSLSKIVDDLKSKLLASNDACAMLEKCFSGVPQKLCSTP
ncbi:THAP domain-containing protein 1-like [Rhipicephalus sanguineus]|uniref:THAP domain-containing protein 1-like n=1 Tax=Rhipicephalus sanguineus TaxID=34632 RepID=UPI0020C1D41E|nr:THAP domain-containing protein 1-like [Rhipicephalus sanguineus]